MMAAKTDVGAPDATEPAVKLVEVRLKGYYVPADAQPAETGGTYLRLEPGTVVSLPAPEAIRLLKAEIAELTGDAYEALGK